MPSEPPTNPADHRAAHAAPAGVARPGAAQAPAAAMASTSASRGRRAAAHTRAYDRIAEAVITLGGLGVLAAMLGICVYLVQTATPLFRGATVSAGDTTRLNAVAADAPRPVAVRLDAPGVAGVVYGSGRVEAVAVHAGEAGASPSAWAPLAGLSLLEGEGAPSFVATQADGRVVLGLSTGGVVVRALEFQRRPLSDEAARPALGASGGTPEGAAALVAVPAGADSPVRAALGLAAGDASAWIERPSAPGAPATLWSLRAGEATTLDPPSGVAVPVTHAHESGTGVRRRSAVARWQDGRAAVATVRRTTGLASRAGRATASWESLRLMPPVVSAAGAEASPRAMMITAEGQDVLVAWPGGHVQRYARVNAEWALAETLAPADTGPGGRVTAATAALGDVSLLVGDASGHLQGFSVAPDAASADGRGLRRTSRVRLADAAVLALATSPRDRTVALAFADGSAAVHHVTSGKTLARLRPTEIGGAGAAGGREGEGVVLAGLSPALDRAALLSGDAAGVRIDAWGMDPGHADAGVGSLFFPVHYEGYASAGFVYQSSGPPGTEPKLSLVPLVFGTLKATLVSLFFAAPLGVLAAVFSSEFLHPDVRRVIKPTIELMASLPSVVLGFVAAMLVAPWVRDHLAVVLVALFAVPIAVLLGANLWRLVPAQAARRARTLGLLSAIGGAVVLGGVLAALLAGPVTRALFSPTADDRRIAAGLVVPASEADAAAGAVPAGSVASATPAQQRELRSRGLYVRGGALVRPDAAAAAPAPDADVPPAATLRAWLDTPVGSPLGGWALLAFAPAAALVAAFDARVFGKRWAAAALATSLAGAAMVELGRFALLLVVSAGAALGVAAVLARLGLDARDSLLGPFDQRNTLVVGLIMGFAVIPIIYTISEDALRAVPDQLRSASLGCGATRWQTASRVVLPVAASGIFSACMIGLGRAVGETMIVLMATGNTPEISASIFDGFRTLSANIAVELPEAPRDSTHYRVLFLCGLVLFLVTLVINTTAELVRQHFRKKSAAL